MLPCQLTMTQKQVHWATNWKLSFPCWGPRPSLQNKTEKSLHSVFPTSSVAGLFHSQLISGVLFMLSTISLSTGQPCSHAGHAPEMAPTASMPSSSMNAILPAVLLIFLSQLLPTLSLAPFTYFLLSPEDSPKPKQPRSQEHLVVCSWAICVRYPPVSS